MTNLTSQHHHRFSPRGSHFVARHRALLAGAVVLTSLCALLWPAEAATKPVPHTVSLRLASVKQHTVLVAPGLAMSRATRQLMPGQSLTFPSEPLRRPVTIDSRPFLRLHLSHTVPGDVNLYLRIEVLNPEGQLRQLMPSRLMTVREALMSQGPAADIDFRLPRVTGKLGVNERLQVVLSELGSAPTDAIHPDVLTVYLGALPGEDSDTHDVNQVLDESKGGKDPARISLSVIGEGAFQPW
jgi:hypothetical protein